jgi:hypothetical protein
MGRVATNSNTAWQEPFPRMRCLQESHEGEVLFLTRAQGRSQCFDREGSGRLA